MPPKKQLPPKRGPRPRRLTRAVATKVTAPNPNPSSLKSIDNGNTKTTPQSAIDAAVLQVSSSCSSPICTETTSIAQTTVRIGVEEKQGSSLMETKQNEGISAGNETLATEVNNAPKNTLGIDAVTEEKEDVKPKKKVKKVVVKVVKKVVKKRVPKSMIKDFAACSSSSSKELTAKDEAFDDDNGEKTSSEGLEKKEDEILDRAYCNGSVLEEEVGNVDSLISEPIEVVNCDVDVPFGVQGVECIDQMVGVSMDFDDWNMIGEGAKEVPISEISADTGKNGGMVQKFDSIADEMPVEVVNVESAEDRNIEGAIQKFDSVANEMPVEEMNVESAEDRDIEGAIQNFDSVTTEMSFEVANVELVGNRNNKHVVQKSDSVATEIPREVVNFDLVGDRCNGGGVHKSDTAPQIPLEVVNVDFIGDRNNECTVQKSDSATDLSMEVVNGDLVVGNRNDEDAVQKSDSTTELPMEVSNVDLIGDRNNKNVAQVLDSRSGYEEGRKEDSEMGNGRIVFSGELEALERRRRRRTEIFIGGLSTDAKEEDVRKVFGEVGEIVELRLVINSKTGKNKGFAFVRYASAAYAKKALEKYAKVEICGKLCSTAPVEGNDTIFLGNIDKKWTNEDVMQLLQEIGVEKIDKVTVMTNPSNVGRNRGFAFVELETHKDAQIAFKKLQKDIGKLQNVKVAWAEPLNEPDEEELQKVKSVYAEYLPSSWNEEKLRSYFIKFGEIENIVLSRNLHSSRRKDFAFINFKTREAALACIESFNHETLTDDGSQVNVKVSLAKPVPKGKPHKNVSKPTRKEISKQKHAIQYPVKPTETRNKEIPAIHIKSQRINDSRSPGTSELEQLLAERALRKQMQSRLGTGITNWDYSKALAGQKRSFSAMGDDLSYSDPREQTRIRMESSFLVGSLSHREVPPRAGMVPHSYYQRQGADYGLGHRSTDFVHRFQREEAPYRGMGRDYYRY